jgi:uncharacterized RDD family membrane protein YckC
MNSPPNVFAPPKSHVADVSESTGPVKATRGSRLGCAMLDGLIFFVPFIPAYVKAWPAAMHLATSNNGHMPVNPAVIYGTMFAAAGWWGVVGLLVSLPIWGLTLYWVHKYGQTIGKRWVGIKVLRADGSRAGLGRIFWLRNFLNGLLTLIPFVGRFYALADMLFIFGGKLQCLHDKIADTIVVKA